MQNLTYRNIDVVHFARNPVFLLEPGDDMKLQKVLFENVRINADGFPVSEKAFWNVEGRTETFTTDEQQWLAIVRPAITQYNRKQVWGRIDGVTFRNIDLTGRPGKYSIIVEGASDFRDTRISNVSFENVRVLGERITMDSLRFVLGFWVRPSTNGITVR